MVCVKAIRGNRGIFFMNFLSWFSFAERRIPPAHEMGRGWQNAGAPWVDGGRARFVGFSASNRSIPGGAIIRSGKIAQCCWMC